MSLEALQKKIKIMTDLKDVVGTMKMLSSVQVGMYEKMSQKLVAYQRNLHQALQAVMLYWPSELGERLHQDNGWCALC